MVVLTLDELSRVLFIAYNIRSEQWNSVEFEIAELRIAQPRFSIDHRSSQRLVDQILNYSNVTHVNVNNLNNKKGKNIFEKKKLFVNISCTTKN